MKLKPLLIAALLLAPTAALAAPGVVTVSVGMKAGPGPGFPTVDRIPGGTRVDIHGCLRGGAWCDVSWRDDRGWVSSRYLEYLYRNHYVYLPDYVDEVDVVPFVLSSYWSSYYAGRPWYHRRAYWSGYWQSHARFATQMPANRSARFGRTEARTAVTGMRTPNEAAPSQLTRRQSLANLRGAPLPQGRMAHIPQGRMAHINGANRTFSGTPPVMARGHDTPHFSAAPRVSAAPMARPAMPAHIAQPGAGHFGGSPMNAHAQMGAPRAAPAMPQIGGGPAHINAAPRVGGGPPAAGPAAGGPPGHQRH
jgi:uncharacterized protein YraI